MLIKFSVLPVEAQYSTYCNGHMTNAYDSKQCKLALSAAGMVKHTFRRCDAHSQWLILHSSTHCNDSKAL